VQAYRFASRGCDAVCFHKSLYPTVCVRIPHVINSIFFVEVSFIPGMDVSDPFWPLANALVPRHIKEVAKKDGLLWASPRATAYFALCGTRNISRNGLPEKSTKVPTRFMRHGDKSTKEQWLPSQLRPQPTSHADHYYLPEVIPIELGSLSAAQNA
jgi:hypothetical protein